LGHEAGDTGELQFDQTTGGRILKLLNIVDEHTCEGAFRAWGTSLKSGTRREPTATLIRLMLSCQAA
jgi:hypothetical protein